MRDIKVGMRVKGSDHQDLGRVVRVDRNGITVDKGHYFVHEYRVRREEVIRLVGDTVVVSQHRPEVAQSAGLARRRRRRAGM